MQIVNVLVGPPGSGKSFLVRGTVISRPGRYLVAVPTIDLANEQSSVYSREAPLLPLHLVHSRNGMRGTVERQFEEAVDHVVTQGRPHAVVFITHETLLSLDLRALADWHVVIDEVPHAIRCGSLKVPLSHRWLAEAYDLHPVGSGWSVVTPRMAATPWHTTMRDSLFAKSAEFDQEARRPHGVLVNAARWEQVEERGCLEWVSAWTPAALSHCASVTIGGAGFFRSLAYRVSNLLHPHMQFLPQQVPVRARPAVPTLRLHYFVEAHRGSCAFWQSRAGRAVLAPIRQFLAGLPNLGFWSGNDVVEQQFDSVLPGASFVRPKAVIGSNELEERTSCAFIYSAQAVPQDRPLQLFGLGKAEIEQSREFEDLYQFIMRGSLRNPAFGGTFDAYLYSQAQAEEVARRATEDGIANIELVPHPEVGVMGVVRGKAKPVPTPEENEAKEQKKRADDAKRKRDDRQRKAALAGRSGKPGRPRKAAVPPPPQP